MSKSRPPLTLVDRQSPILSPDEERLFTTMVEAWRTRRLGSQRHVVKSVERDLSVIADFVRFTGRPPWDWTDESFERWCAHLWLDRRLAPATQRHYQAAIRSFLQYLVDNVRFPNEVRRLFGCQLVQICNSENCIPHTDEFETTSERRAMTHEELETFIKAIDGAIEEARRFRIKNLRPLQRDKVMFFTVYALGLRASEALGLDTTSFYENPALPRFGRYGIVSVWGKGSRGSGKRNRHVITDHIALPPLLDWYLTKIRPAFMINADPNEEALFLSERGKRLAISTFEARFQELLVVAGLEGRDLTPHCLRHSSVTHGQVMGLSLEAVRRKHGHAFGATTQIYTHLPDEFVADDIQRAIDLQISRALHREGG